MNSSKQNIYPSVAIIVLNWNGWIDTKECLISLSNLTYSNYQTIVVDNGSTDDSVEQIKLHFPQVEIIENYSNLGFAAGNNRAIIWALEKNADFIMLLNNDTVVDPGFVEPLIEVFDSDSKIGFASSKIYYYNNPNTIWFFGGEIDWNTGWAYHKNPNKEDSCGLYEGILSTPIVTGCCLFAKKEVFEKVGLLDEKFYLIYEDMDWSVRATQEGYKGFVIANSKIWHKVSASFKRDKPSQSNYYFIRNGLLFIKKHSKKPLFTSLKFIWLRAIKPSIKQAQLHEKFWFRNCLINFSGILAFCLNQYQSAPYYVKRLCS